VLKTDSTAAAKRTVSLAP